MTLRHHLRRTSLLAASAGAAALLSTTALGQQQQSPTRYGDWPSTQAYQQSLQGPGQGMYGGQGGGPQLRTMDQGAGLDQPLGPYTYGTSGPSYRGEPYEIGPMGPLGQTVPRQPGAAAGGPSGFGERQPWQELSPTGRQAFGWGYAHGRAAVRAEVQQRIDAIAEELFQLGYAEGLEEGLRGNPNLQAGMMPGGAATGPAMSERRIDQAYAAWQANQPPASSVVPGYATRGRPDGGTTATGRTGQED